MKKCRKRVGGGGGGVRTCTNRLFNEQERREQRREW